MRQLEPRSEASIARPADATASSLFPQSGGAIDFRELRTLVRIADLLRLLDWKPVERHGDQLRGPCFMHGSSSENSRSLSVNLSKNAYRCFAACCGSQGNQLDLYAAATKLPLYQASLEICDRLGLAPPPGRKGK
jgi:DNA primase